jgi:hypothetical protein
MSTALARRKRRGGTWFVGRAIPEELIAAARTVLVAHRGVTEPSDLPWVQHLQAERRAWPDQRAAFAPLGATRPSMYRRAMRRGMRRPGRA